VGARRGSRTPQPDHSDHSQHLDDGCDDRNPISHSVGGGDDESQSRKRQREPTKHASRACGHPRPDSEHHREGRGQHGAEHEKRDPHTLGAGDRDGNPDVGGKEECQARRPQESQLSRQLRPAIYANTRFAEELRNVATPAASVATPRMTAAGSRSNGLISIDKVFELRSILHVATMRPS
jgi:hypothetical protein